MENDLNYDDIGDDIHDDDGDLRFGVEPLIMSGLQLAAIESNNENNDERYRICKVVVWIHDR